MTRILRIICRALDAARTANPITTLARIAMLFGWCITTAYAAKLVAPDLVRLPWTSIAIAGAIAMWGGMAATLGRLERAAAKLSIVAALLKDAFLSGTAGVIVYAVGAWREWSVWEVAVVLLLAGYGGSRTLDAGVDWLLNMIRGFRGPGGGDGS